MTAPKHGQPELDEILARLIAVKANSREELKLRVSELLNDSHDPAVLDRHNTDSIMFIFTADGERYGLKIEYGSAQVTRDEAHWYELAPDRLKRHHIASHLGQDYAFVLLRWLQNARTLEEVAIAHEGTDSYITMDYVIKVLDQDRELLAAHPTISLISDKENGFFYYKYNQAAEQAAKYPYLTELLHAETVTVNGKRLPGPDRFVRAVQQDDTLRTYLSPDKAGLIHGDTHADNLLVEDGEIYMIDPNGLDHIPIEYDYGRILWSMYGWNAIVRGEFTLAGDHVGGYTLDITRRQQYLDGLPRLREYFTAQEYHRAMYSSAVQFLTRVTHAEDPQETKALYLRGLEVFAELFEDLNIRA